METADNSTIHNVDSNSIQVVGGMTINDTEVNSSQETKDKNIFDIKENTTEPPATLCKIEREETEEINLALEPKNNFVEEVNGLKKEDCSSIIQCQTENDSVCEGVHWPFISLNPEELTVKEEKPNIDVNKLSKVTLKRKSDSLALISSYDISSESEEDLHKSAFSKPQKPTDIIVSSSDTETDSGSLFNLDSDDASNESSQSSDESNNTDDNKIRKQKSAKGAKAKAPLACFDLGDLPPIKDLQISVKEDECLPFGKVHSIVETLVVIESLPDVPALNLDSVLFTKSGDPLGEVFDVFGPVKRPYYTIRFKNRNDIDEKSLSVGTTVYCAPKTKYTQYVFIHQLARMKGSDASWKDDIEPPPEFLDYSDDEQERLAKRLLKEAKAKARVQQILEKEAPPLKKTTFEERMNQRNTLRNQMFIMNSPPDNRRTDWFRNIGGTSSESPRSCGIVRPTKFNPIQFQRPPDPRSSFFSPHGIGQSSLASTSVGAFPIRSQLFNNVFRIRSPGLFPPPGSQSNMNGSIFSPPRPQPFQGNNNHPFQAPNPPFSQSKNIDFQQQPNQFSFPPGPQIFQSPNPQSKNLPSAPNSSAPFPGSPNSSFQNHMNPGSYQQNCTLLAGNSASLPPFPRPRPLHPTRQFGPAVSRPFSPNSPPYAPSALAIPPPFSFPPNMPPPRHPFSPNSSFTNNPSHQPSFRPYNP